MYWGKSNLESSPGRNVEIFEELANSVDCLLKKVEEVHGEVSKILELPANNHYWKSEVLRKLLSNQRLEFEGIVNGCSMKMFTKSQQPVGKRFRFMSNRKEVANRLAERFKVSALSSTQLSTMSIGQRQNDTPVCSLDTSFGF